MICLWIPPYKRNNPDSFMLYGVYFTYTFILNEK